MALPPLSRVCASLDVVRFALPSASATRPFPLSAGTSFSGRRLRCHPGVVPATRLKVEENFLSVRATTEQTVSGKLGSVDQVDEDECELVSRLELTLGDGQDATNAYIVKAVKNNNGAAVLLLTDIFGFNNNDTRDFAYRLSCFGYNVLVPDLFQGNPFAKDRPQSEIEDWRAKHTPESVLRAVKTSADWLTEEMTAAGVTKKLGLLGFCFGGGYVFEVLAKDEKQQYVTAVSFYPTKINNSLATTISVPILLITGDKDNLCSPENLQHLSSQIKGSELRVYPGRGHGFAHCPTADDDEDAENAFQAMKTWFHEKLLTQQPGQ